jgi:hypothetical protein
MSRTPWKYHARQGEEIHPQAQTPVQNQSNVMPYGQRRAIRGYGRYGQCELHRRWLLGIRLLRIPNAMVLEHPDEFVRKVVGAMGVEAVKARK